MTTEFSGLLATVHYDGAALHVPVEIAENIQDAMAGIDKLGGGHWFVLTSDEIDTKLWLARSVPLRIDFPSGYEAAEDRQDYVSYILDIRARLRLELDSE